jgi:3-oxoacyl-[acyl-carrier-protein] synthase II
VSRPVAVTAAGAITSIGDDLDTTFAGLAAGQTGFREVDRFDVSTAVNTRGAFRKDGAPAGELVRHVIESVAAGHGPLTVDRAYFAGTPDEPAPALPDTVVHTDGSGGREAGGWDRIYTGACVSSSSALVDAAAAIAHGWCTRVLVVAARVIDQGTFHVFSAGGAMTPEPVPRPLTVGRSGVLLGDGAAAFLLEATDALADRTPYVALTGWARAGDGFHPFQPEPHGRGMVTAIERALALAGPDAGRVDHVSVHGTGTGLSDAAEVAALATVFDGEDRIPPTCAPKSALGHTLEGAGLVEAALAARAITAGTLPPSLGIRTEDEVLFPGVTRQAMPGRDPAHVLNLNLAFGGCNTAIVLSRWSAPDSPPSRPAPRPAPRPALRPAGELRAVVGPNPDAPVVPSFIESRFPPAVYDAAHRCLTIADLSPPERARTAVLVLTPNGDGETRAVVASYLRAGRRIPPPLFVQSTPSSIVGRIARDWDLRGAINTVSTPRALDDPVVAEMVAEMAVTDGSRAVLVIRHLPATGDAPSTAEAAVYSF